MLHAKFSDYSYREAALNPTNPEDRANDWEADIINDFRDHPQKTEIVMQRGTAMGPTLNLARPLVAKPACLTCHSTPQAAPASMVALYGSQNGFGWKPNEIIGAQVVSVPMSVPIARAAHVRLLFLATYGGVFALLFVLLNLLLGFMVVGPIDKMARTAEAVSLGRWTFRNMCAAAPTRSRGSRTPSISCGAASTKPCVCSRRDESSAA